MISLSSDVHVTIAGALIALVDRRRRRSDACGGCFTRRRRTCSASPRRPRANSGANGRKHHGRLFARDRLGAHDGAGREAGARRTLRTARALRHRSSVHVAARRRDGVGGARRARLPSVRPKRSRTQNNVTIRTETIKARSTKQAVLDVAKREKANLIILGSYREGKYSGAPLGRTIEEIAADAKCDVLIGVEGKHGTLLIDESVQSSSQPA